MSDLNQVWDKGIISGVSSQWFGEVDRKRSRSPRWFDRPRFAMVWGRKDHSVSVNKEFSFVNAVKDKRKGVATEVNRESSLMETVDSQIISS